MATEDDGVTPESDMSGLESGPYCKHWGEPGLCEECAVELLRSAGYFVIPPKKKGGPK